MTAHPTSFDFMANSQTAAPVLVRPKVFERYWGYEIVKNEMEIDLAVLARCASVLVMIGAFVAAFGVWLVPDMAFAGTGPMVKFSVSLFLLAVACTLFRFATRSTRVRVQIDTATGELREIVTGPFGSEIVLAHYGFDAIEAVAVVASKLDPTVGQLQINLKGGSVIPAGDGALIALRHLRDRVVTDCGLARSGGVKPAIWVGPIGS